MEKKYQIFMKIKTRNFMDENNESVESGKGELLNKHKSVRSDWLFSDNILL